MRTRNFKGINLRSDLLATIFSFGAQGTIKLGSSVVMTRMLQPDAWGVITILMAIVFVVEMSPTLVVNDGEAVTLTVRDAVTAVVNDD